jgi:hypothetical protein
MEDYAYLQFQSFYRYFENLADDRSSRHDLSSHRRFEAEEFLNSTTFNGDLEQANDPESLLLKSTILAKYMTLD